jgi:WhiB family transcriptional regulator, redox-sensing transcriptional regulator
MNSQEQRKNGRSSPCWMRFTAPLPEAESRKHETMTNHWRQYARCLGADPELFYPPSESDDGSLEAKAICAVCPVREPCLDHAINAREKQGVWGGLDERERRRLVRQRRKTA